MIQKAFDNWRRHWTRQRIKHGLGPTDDVAWRTYVNSLSMFDVLENLTVYEIEP